MTEAALDALGRELGGDPPDGVEALGAQGLGEFTRTLLLAKRNQQAQVQSAVDDALSHVPALLRGAVRKLLDAYQ